MSDEPDRQDLEDRVDQLESTISKMLPSRRDALKLGGAALVGGAAMSGTASAGDESEGTIGTAAEPVDVESEDINNADTVTTQDLVVNGTATGPFSGDGIVFEDGDPITEHRVALFDAPTQSFFDIFNLTNPVDVYGGSVYGAFPSRIRITFDSNNVTTIGQDNSFDIGEDFTGDRFSVHPIFPMSSVKRLEIYNDNNMAGSSVLGFQVFTT